MMIVSLYNLMLGFLILVVAGLTAVGQASMLQIAFPLLALGIGLFTLRTSPTRHYVQFVMLLWMFAPFVRRLADWQGSHIKFSLIIVAPLLVTLLSFLLLPRRWPRSQATALYSFLLYLVVVLWGTIMGLIAGQAFAAIYAMLTWVAPVGFAMMILSRSNRLDEISDALAKVLVYGGAIMAIYGFIQFVLVPPWDKAWAVTSGMRSIGQMVAYKIRIFSTMNSPGVLAISLMVALLIIFNRPSPKYLIAGAPILLAMGLTLVRGAWGGFAIGLLVLMLVGKVRVKFRVMLIGGAGLLIAIPLFLQSTFFASVSDRADSLWSLQSDHSFQVRDSFASMILSDIPSLALGHGLGVSGVASGLVQSTDTQGTDTVTSFDNGFLDILFSYGLVGIVMFGIIAFWAMRLVQAARTRPAYAGSAVIPLVGFAELMLVDPLYSPIGMVLFPFLGLALASISQKRTGETPKTLNLAGAPSISR